MHIKISYWPKFLFSEMEENYYIITLYFYNMWDSQI